MRPQRLDSLGGERLTYCFTERLAFSKGARQETDEATILSLLDGCASVSVAGEVLDKKGVDFIATLRKGAEVFVDVKTRSKGCSKYWIYEPELAIEIWSVVPNEDRFVVGKVGWTFDESKITDMILYTFAPEDSDTAFLLPFQSLRIAARRNINSWMLKYKIDTQNSGTWRSRAVFVPVSEVISAINNTFSQTL